MALLVSNTARKRPELWVGEQYTSAYHAHGTEPGKCFIRMSDDKGIRYSLVLTMQEAEQIAKCFEIYVDKAKRLERGDK